MNTAKSIFLFMLIILVSWAYVHMGFMLINSVEERSWANMDHFERVLMISGSALVICAIFITFAFGEIARKR